MSTTIIAGIMLSVFFLAIALVTEIYCRKSRRGRCRNRGAEDDSVIVASYVATASSGSCGTGGGAACDSGGV